MLVDAVNDNADDEMNDESCNCSRFDDKLVNKADPNVMSWWVAPDCKLG